MDQLKGAGSQWLLSPGGGGSVPLVVPHSVLILPH